MIVRRFWWAGLLAIAVLTFSAHYSLQAPTGAWGNRIFGEPAWGEADPGNSYFTAAHEIGWGEAPLFVGHPGTPLLPLLYVVQIARYRALADAGTSYTRFTAQHLPATFVASKLMMTVLHLLSFCALYGMTRQLLHDHRAAALATLGYATCFPVLYFLSRISPEPILIGGIAAAFWGTWRYEDLVRAGRPAAALTCAAGAAVAAVSAALAKIAFAGPLPFLLALHIGAGAWRSEPGGPIPWRVRLQALGAFAAASLVSLALYSQIIDWTRFIGIWRLIAGLTVTDGWTLADAIPGLGAHHIYLVAEPAFIVCAAIGWWRFLRRRPADRRRALWLSVFGAYGLLFFVYRVVIAGNFLPFHYSFVFQATAAVFFGYAGVEAWQRLRMPWDWRAGAATATLLATLHGVGLAAVVDARRSDIAGFAGGEPAYRLVEQLRPGDRIAIPKRPGQRKPLRNELMLVHGFFYPFFWQERESVLAEEFASYFLSVPPAQMPAQAQRTLIPVLDTHVAVIRSGE